MRIQFVPTVSCRGERKGRPPKGRLDSCPVGAWVVGEYPPDCRPKGLSAVMIDAVRSFDVYIIASVFDVFVLSHDFHHDLTQKHQTTDVKHIKAPDRVDHDSTPSFRTTVRRVFPDDPSIDKTGILSTLRRRHPRLRRDHGIPPGIDNFTRERLSEEGSLFCFYADSGVMHTEAYRTFRVGFNADGTRIYRDPSAF